MSDSNNMNDVTQSSVFNPNPSFANTELPTEYGVTEHEQNDQPPKKYKVEVSDTFNVNSGLSNDTSMDTFDNYDNTTTMRSKDVVRDVKKVESLNRIIESLDTVSVVDDDTTYEEKSTRVIDNEVVARYDAMFSNMRIDLAKILSILKTQNEKINNNENESNSIKGDLHDIASALSKLNSKIDNFNNESIHRQERHASKHDTKLSNLARRIEALEKSNFVSRENITQNTQSVSNTNITNSTNNTNNTNNDEVPPAKRDANGNIVDKMYVDKSKIQPRRVNDSINGVSNEPTTVKPISRTTTRRKMYETNTDIINSKKLRQTKRGFRKKNTIVKRSIDVIDDVAPQPMPSKRINRDIINK